MNAEVAHFGELQLPKVEKERRRGQTVLIKSSHTIVVSAETYDPKVLSKRPDGWNDLRIKRVMLKEHIDRIAGVDEEELLNKRGDREIEVRESCTEILVHIITILSCNRRK
jgi:hypothetical protein